MAETMSSLDNTNAFITDKPYFANPDDGLPESLAPADKSPFRKIEFLPARKPFTGFTNGGGSFRIETLNPTTGSSNDAHSNQQRGGLDRVCGGSSGKKRDASEFENGLDPELSFGITFRRIGAGLENLGNTCFLNSVLQCLTYTEPLAAYLQSGKHQVTCRNAGFCALCAIQKHVSRALQSSGRSLAPKDLVSNLRCISRTFRNSRQEDAHEYMVNLLESMHKCCLPSGVPTESQSAYERSLVHKIFGGRLRSQVKCLQCNYCSNKFDPFLDLSLEILKADTLYKAFANFTAKEHLDGGAKQYQCQQCKQKVKALKQLTIHKAPNVLTIHLKRFGSHISGQKIDKKVHFAPTLDLKPFVTGPYDEELKYTLYGVLVHAGWSTHSGHYYCFVRTSSGMWYSLDDNHVIQVSERKVFEQKAYMLFYFRDRKNFPSKKPTDMARNNTHPIIFNGPKPSTTATGTEKNTPNSNNASSESQIKEISSQKHILESHLETGPKVMPKPSVLAENGKDCSIKSDLSVEKGHDILKHDEPIKVESHINNGAQNSINEKKEPSMATVLPESTAVTINGSKPLMAAGDTVIGTEKTSSEKIGEISQEVAPKMDSSSTKEKSLDKKTNKKSKKFLKCNVKSMKLCSKILMGASLNQRKKKKRKHGKKSKSSVKNRNQEILNVNGVPMDEGPSSSREVNPREVVKHSSDEGQTSSVKVNSQTKVNIDPVEIEYKERVNKDGAVLATCMENDSNGVLGRRMSEVKGSNGSNDCKRTSSQKELVHMLTRSLGERTVPRWDDNGSTPSHTRDTQRVLTIGYVGDEWDEEYDRGKKKKVRISKTEFDGKNPFQEIANERLKSDATKQRQPLRKPPTRRNKHFKKSRSGNKPYITRS